MLTMDKTCVAKAKVVQGWKKSFFPQMVRDERTKKETVTPQTIGQAKGKQLVKELFSASA